MSQTSSYIRTHRLTPLYTFPYFIAVHNVSGPGFVYITVVFLLVQTIA